MTRLAYLLLALALTGCATQREVILAQNAADFSIAENRIQQKLIYGLMDRVERLEALEEKLKSNHSYRYDEQIVIVPSKPK